MGEKKYAVRRLMPIECARLQGFHDNWGKPRFIQEMSDEEAEFWYQVRKTHSEINGKKMPKMLTKESVLKWYASLHTDANEYKMWGNGVNLPCCETVVMRVAEYLRNETTKGEE